MTLIVVITVALVITAIIVAINQSPEEKNRQRYGNVNAAMICQHCGVSGKIRTKKVTRKKGVSGGKATAALLTGGVSLLATGLSRKEKSTQAHCTNCKNTWYF